MNFFLSFIFIVSTALAFDAGLGFGFFLFGHFLFLIWFLYVGVRTVHFRKGDLITFIMLIIFMLFTWKNVREIDYYFLSMNVLFFVYSSVFFSSIYVKKHAEKILGRFYFVSLLAFSLEAVYRILNPDFTINNYFEEHPLLYAYKYNSLFYDDSNYVALHLVSLLLLSYCSSQLFSRHRFFPALFLVLLILTLSRSAILAIFLVLAGLWYCRRFSVKVVIATLSVSIVAIVAAVSLEGELALQTLGDSSLISKIVIFSNLGYILNHTGIEDFFLGRGFGSVGSIVSLFSMQGHIHVYDVFVWFGISGFLCFFLIFSRIYFFDSLMSQWVLLFLLTYTIAGLSMAVPFAHYFWFTFGALVQIGRWIERYDGGYH